MRIKAQATFARSPVNGAQEHHRLGLRRPVVNDGPNTAARQRTVKRPSLATLRWLLRQSIDNALGVVAAGRSKAARLATAGLLKQRISPRGVGSLLGAR